MKHRKHYVAALVVGIVLLAGGILLYSRFSGPKSILHCSPTQPRPSGIKGWKKIMAPAQLPAELDRAFFDKCTVTSDDESYSITHPSENPVDNVFAYENSKIAPGEPLDIGGGTLTLSAMGAAYLDSKQTIDDDAAYRFYDARLKSIRDDQAKKFDTLGSTETGANFRDCPFPKVQFGFEYQGIEDLMFHSIKIFDASTKTMLSSGGSSSGGLGHHWFKSEIPFWHRTPVDIVLDVSYGPSKTFDFAPHAGEGFVIEGAFECRLLCVQDGVDRSYISRSGSDNTSTAILRKAPPDKGTLRFVFGCQPQASRMPVSFEFLDAEGKKLYGGGSSTSSNIHSVNMDQPLEKIALIRARYRTRRQRILIHLPYIPGLPEENNTIDDLLDVRIPYVRFRNVDQFATFFRQTLQLSTAHETGPTPPRSINSVGFPLDFSDTTMRELAEIYAENGTLEIEIENDQLILKYPIPLRTRLRQAFQKLLRR
jgi:hypothetical protein